MSVEKENIDLGTDFPFTLKSPKPYLYAYTPLHNNLFLRSFRINEQLFVCKVTQEKQLTRKCNLTIESNETILEKEKKDLIERIRYELGLDQDMNPYVIYGRKNRAYRRVLNAYPGFRIAANSNIVELTVLSLLAQHTTFPEWLELTKRFYKKFGQKIPWDKRILVFPEIEELEKIGKTGWKSIHAHMQAKYLTKLTAEVLEDVETFTYYPIYKRGLSRLKTLPGISTVTARVLMIYGARRYEKSIYNLEIRNLVKHRFDKEFKSVSGFDKWLENVFPDSPAVLMHPLILYSKPKMHFDSDFYEEMIPS